MKTEMVISNENAGKVTEERKFLVSFAERI